MDSLRLALSIPTATAIALLLALAVPAAAQPSSSLSAQRAPSVLLLPDLASQSPHVRISRPARQPSDRWLAADKLKHVTFSFLWTLSAQYVLVDKVGWSDRTALPAAMGSGAAVGVSKELFDWRIGPTGRFSTRDLFADAAGILLAVGVIVL